MSDMTATEIYDLFNIADDCRNNPSRIVAAVPPDDPDPFGHEHADDATDADREQCPLCENPHGLNVCEACHRMTEDERDTYADSTIDEMAWGDDE
jgi:hypothetical protein